MKKSINNLLPIILLFVACSRNISQPAANTDKPVETKAQTATTKTTSDTKAVEVMKAYIDAIGGIDKLSSVKSMMTKMSGATGMGEIIITNYVKEGKSAMKTEMGGSTVMEQIFDGKVILISGMGSNQKITDAVSIRAAAKQARMFDQLDQLISDKTQKKYLGIEDLAGVKVHKIIITDEDKVESTQFIDVSTNYLVRTVTSVDAMGTKSDQTMDMSDYKDVNGMKFPHSIKMSGGAIPFPMEMKITAMMLNSDLPDQLFKIN